MINVKGVNEVNNNLRTIHSSKANWFFHILHRNYLLKHIIEETLEGKIQVTEEEDVRSYWMILRKSEGTGILRCDIPVVYQLQCRNKYEQQS